MKVTLKTRGGWGAAPYLSLPPKTVDLDTLPADAADALVGLVKRAKGVSAPREARPDSIPKGMSYTITIEGDAEPVVLQQSDTMSPQFEALLNWLNDYFARQQPDGRIRK